MNAFLLQIADHFVIVESGCGSVFGSQPGLLAGNLMTVGVRPEDIDTILMTHLHPDNVGGLIGGSRRAVIPNTELIVHADEQSHWSNPRVLANAAEARAWLSAGGCRFVAYTTVSGLSAKTTSIIGAR